MFSGIGEAREKETCFECAISREIIVLVAITTRLSRANQVSKMFPEFI